MVHNLIFAWFIFLMVFNFSIRDFICLFVLLTCPLCFSLIQELLGFLCGVCSYGDFLVFADCLRIRNLLQLKAFSLKAIYCVLFSNWSGDEYFSFREVCHYRTPVISAMFHCSLYDPYFLYPQYCNILLWFNFVSFSINDGKRCLVVVWGSILKKELL